MKHFLDKTCSCHYCTMIDIMFGDPLLNDWEKKFVASVAWSGWQYEYTPKQKATIKRIFQKQKGKYRNMKPETKGSP